jgi:uncharacterized membrane protein
VDGVGAVFAVPIAVTMLTRTELLFVFCVAAAFARACGSILPTRVKSFIFNTFTIQYNTIQYTIAGTQEIKNHFIYKIISESELL